MTSKRLEWAKRLQAWSRSGQTRSAFCRAQRLNLGTFDYWRRVLGDSRGALVPVVVHPPVASAAIGIVLPNGIRLQMASGTDVSQTRALVEALLQC